MKTDLVAGVMLVLMAVALVTALATVLWAAVRTVRRRCGGVARMENRVPARRIALMTLAGTVVLLALTFALGVSEPVLINGKPFANALWLRAAGMFISSSFVLLVVATLAYAYSEVRSNKL